MTYGRTVYSLFSLFGDLGGLLGFFTDLAGFLIAPIADHSMLMVYVATLFRAKSKDITKKSKKKERQRDRSHETDQSDHLEKEEEADPDLEFMSETGHVHAEGPRGTRCRLRRHPLAQSWGSGL